LGILFFPRKTSRENGAKKGWGENFFNSFKGGLKLRPDLRGGTLSRGFGETLGGALYWGLTPGPVEPLSFLGPKGGRALFSGKTFGG